MKLKLLSGDEIELSPDNIESVGVQARLNGGDASAGEQPPVVF